MKVMIALNYILIVSACLLSSAICVDIDPPPGNTEFFRSTGVGTMNYECKDGIYVFSNTVGTLIDQFERAIDVGVFLYPSVTSAWFRVGHNSTAIHSKKIATSPSSVPASMPNALFQVTGRTGPGNLEGATFVQMTDTVSGIASETKCVDGVIDSVTFRATYRFFTRMTGSRYRIRPRKSRGFLMSTQCLGTYNYVCKNNVWVFVSVKGDLSPIGNSYSKIGTYSYYPTAAVINDDGQHVFTIGSSSVTFKTDATEISRIPDIIPEESYYTTSTTAGRLENVKYGLRINTSGGIEPSSPCTDDQISVPFSAQYLFYV